MCCDSCIRESSPPTIAPSGTCGRPSSHARSRTARKMSAARGHSKPSSAYSIPFASSTLPQPFRLSPGLSPVSLHPPEQRFSLINYHKAKGATEYVSDSGENTNEIDYSVSHSSGSYVRGHHPVSRAGRQADRLGQGGCLQWQDDRDEGQGRGRLPPVFHGGEKVRSHHGRPEEYRRAPFRLRLLRRT